MKVGFIAGHDLRLRTPLSGMPYSMAGALAAAGCEIVPFVPAEGLRRRPRSRLSRFVPVPFKRVLKKVLGIGTNGAAEDLHDYAAMRDRTVRLSREIRDRIRESDVDLVFGCCISRLLFELDVPVPIVYCTDITARLILGTYPRIRQSPEPYRRLCEEQEERGLRRASAVVLASECTRRSVVEDYGVDPSRAFVVPMGANVERETGASSVIRPEAPSRSSLRLVITAADPERKRLDLAIDVVDELRRQGWEASLEFIGPPTSRARTHPHVRCLGLLSLDSGSDRRRNREALGRSHFMILPSEAEAFGIAPCEAAHAGTPSVVSDAGGLPEVVRDGVTGLVLPSTAPASVYAEAIIGLARDPDRYRAMSVAAFNRARATFTWERWAEGVLGVMNRVLRKQGVSR